MLEIKVYDVEMQQDIESFFVKCFSDLGQDYDPNGEHSDIINIQESYMLNGCMWCMYNNHQIIGTIAVRTLNMESKIIEIKRLYVLNEYQGNGYGNILFETALNYAKENKYYKIYADAAKDRDASRHLLSKYGFTQIPRYSGSSQYTELFFELKLV